MQICENLSLEKYICNFYLFPFNIWHTKYLHVHVCSTNNYLFDLHLVPINLGTNIALQYIFKIAHLKYIHIHVVYSIDLDGDV